MRKLIVKEWMTLDGVIQSPIYPDEDPSGGFRHGGWHFRYFDDVSRAWVEENLNRAGGFLYGRWTFEKFASHWPNADGPEELKRPLTEKPRYVVSRTLRAPAAWDARLLSGDLAKEVNALKREPGGDLYVLGSAALVRSLMAADLIDELRLMIDPIVVGGGKRLFRDDGGCSAFRLVDSRATSTGALLSTYARA